MTSVTSDHSIARTKVGVPTDQVDRSLKEIEQKLAVPAIEVHLAFPGGRRPENECRAFLSAVVRPIRGMRA